MREIVRLAPAAGHALVPLALAACAFREPAADGPLVARVDSVFAGIRSDSPGCAVGIYRDGRVVLTRTYGVANVEDRRPITTRTVFNLGSGAKPFTALAALELEKDGRLSLDDDVRRFVPELPDYGTPIRIRDLLQHTSGLRDFGTLGLFTGHEAATMPEFVRLMASQRRLNFTPGTRHEYSHSDFVMLAVVIERVVGEPFGMFIEREVLRPLGMTTSGVDDARGLPVRERAFGHDSSSTGVRVLLTTSDITGGSNVYTSLDDLLHWDRALNEGAGGRGPVARILTRPTMPNGDTIPYAYGLRRRSYRGLPTIERAGHVPGIAAEFVRFPAHRTMVAVFCNENHLYPYRLTRRVVDAYLGDSLRPLPPVPALPPAVPISGPELQRYVGHYSADERADVARFAIVGGRLVELLGDTAQTFTHHGNGLFTGDGSPNDFRATFTQVSPTSPMKLEYSSEGETLEVLHKLADPEVWRPDASTLGQYSGVYYSEDLGVVWQLRVRDGSLVLRRTGLADMPLVPIRRDTFTRGFGSWSEPLVARFEFRRDSARRVTGFGVSTPPGDDVVRDLEFVRAR